MVLDRYPGRKRQYAETLLHAVDFVSQERPLLPELASGFGQVSSLKERFEMLMHPQLNHRVSRWTYPLLLAIVALLPCMPVRGTAQERSAPEARERRAKAPDRQAESAKRPAPDRRAAPAKRRAEVAPREVTPEQRAAMEKRRAEMAKRAEAERKKKGDQAKRSAAAKKAYAERRGAASRRAGLGQAAEFIKRFDKDGDGKLSEEEKAAAKKAYQERRAKD